MNRSRISSMTNKKTKKEMQLAGQKRVMLRSIYPCIEEGVYPVKRVVGEKVTVQVDAIADGHDKVAVALLYRKKGDEIWQEVRMSFLGNDRYEGSFIIEEMVDYYYTVKGWIDVFATWKDHIAKKWEAKQDVNLELSIGANLLKEAADRSKDKQDSIQLNKWAEEFKDKKIAFYCSYIAVSDDVEGLMKKYDERKFESQYSKQLRIVVDRPKALFSAWYEFFPRSWGENPGAHGTLKESERILPEIAEMGFDVVYLPPIHPIGTAHRKGKNNTTECKVDEPGSPWAIGNKEGGHKAVHPQLGTIADFKHFIKKAGELGLETAMDIAFQCSPDHPYVKEHPQWFKWRPDNTIQYAENPPKKYQDIYPLNFETDDWQNLWHELKSVFMFWIGQGVRIFRVDNPHTKPYAFWQWVIAEIKGDYPEVIFLSEAFTRPKVMQELAKSGFTQSYTYFTWRASQWDLIEYVNELTKTEMREYFRPNFWPNTPDILPFHLQGAQRQAFMMRLILAATLSSNYGIYGPAFELCVSAPVSGKEEYINSEKYEIKQWDWDAAGNLKDLIRKINQIRKDNPALQTTWNTKFIPVNNDNILCYHKITEDRSDRLLIIVNVDPYHTQSGWVAVPVEELGLGYGESYTVHDLISNEKYQWFGQHNYVELNPYICPAHILKIE